MEKIIDRPVLALVFFAIIILLGIYSYNHMTIGLVPDPEQNLPSVTVQYVWPGVSPDIILQKVLIPAENEIMRVKGVEKIKSRALIASGEIRVEFGRNVKLNFAHLVLRERLNRLQRDLPQAVQLTGIFEVVPDDFQQRPLMGIGIYGENYSIYQLRKIAEQDIQPQLSSISGVESANLYGGVQPEIKILTSVSKLERYGLTISHIMAQIGRHFYSKQSLSFEKDAVEINLSLSESPKKITDLQNIFLTKMGSKPLLLKDVADVYLGYGELRFERRYQGKSYLVFDIRKDRSYSHLEVTKKVREKLRELAGKYKGQISFIVQSDESKDLKNELLHLGKIALLTLVIIFIILQVVVRDLKAALLIFSSVFFSVFAALTVIYLMKIDLNILTLSGFALGFGLFVDNAVVVFDSILRHREKGYDRRSAAIEGSKTVFIAVLASTFTNIIVFFTFALFFKDRLKMYYLPLAYVMTLALLASIVVSFVLIPSLASRLDLKLRLKPKEVLFKKGKFFPFIIKYPLIVIIPIILMFTFSFRIFLKEVSFGQFFSWYSKQQVIVWLRFPSGAEFENVQETIDKFEKVALAKPYQKEVNTQITTNTAYMIVTFPPAIENSSYPLQLKQELVGIATNLAGIGVQVAGFDQEPYFYNPDTGSNMPYNIHIKGYNFDKLMKIANDLKENLLAHRRIKDCEIQTDKDFWWGGKEKYFSLKLDRKKLDYYRLPPSFLLGLIAANLRENTNAQRIKFDDKELAIEIKTPDAKNLEIDDLLNMELNYGTTPFRLKDVADIEFTTQKGGITREKQEYWAMVQWDYLGSAKAGDRFHKTLYNNLQLPVGFSKSLDERRFQLSEEEEHQLWWAIWISIGLIYLILGILYEDFFQPFLIMLTIPLSLIGVFLAFWLFDFSFDASGYIGIILMMGIVVNNAILLVDNINHHIEKNSKIIESIVIGTKERIRPIIMTTLTAVLGMLPLVLLRDAGSKGDIWTNLALCTIGGLTSSTLLILFVMPICYYLFYRLRIYISSQGKKNPSPVTDGF
ncbi:MAG TPA: efflux RND transporter permease subunit [Candidatus Kapabacteria bacterium]|nr:efflux RND transporter permease subunit [Candidatus Kapabacteria bacterium]